MAATTSVTRLSLKKSPWTNSLWNHRPWPSAHPGPVLEREPLSPKVLAMVIAASAGTPKCTPLWSSYYPEVPWWWRCDRWCCRYITGPAGHAKNSMSYQPSWGGGSCPAKSTKIVPLWCICCCCSHWWKSGWPWIWLPGHTAANPWVQTWWFVIVGSALGGAACNSPQQAKPSWWDLS